MVIKLMTSFLTRVIDMLTDCDWENDVHGSNCMVGVLAV